MPATGTPATAALMNVLLPMLWDPRTMLSFTDCVPCCCSTPPPCLSPAPAPDDQRGTTVLTVILAAVFILAYVLSMIFMF